MIDVRNAYVTDSMLREVTRSGTGAAALKLARPDLAGKTGTTNDAFDGWFSGYGGGIVAVSWMGFDEPKSLGGREFGATAALPIWLDYMKVALQKRPALERPLPAGLVQVGGEWLYEEFTGDAAVHTLDMEAADEPLPPEAPASN